MASLSGFSQEFLTGALIIYVLVFIYAMYSDWKRDVELDAKHKHLENYYKTIDGNVKDVEMLVNCVLERKEQEKSLFKKLLNSGKTGVFLGSLSGAITGGPAGALATGVVFGLINPIVVAMNDIIHVSEELGTARISRERDDIRKKLGYFPHLPPY